MKKNMPFLIEKTVQYTPNILAFILHPETDEVYAHITLEGMDDIKIKLESKITDLISTNKFSIMESEVQTKLNEIL